jgi:glycosyltransferase involved in cell wall biosynthesis
MDTLRGRETSNFPGTSEILDLPPEAPDLLQVHSLQRWYFDLEALPALSSRIPTVLTLHDAWLLSGHCMHSFDCERWRHGCGECPDLKIPPAVLRDNTRWNWMRKASIFAGSRLWIATPSHWLMDKVQASMLRAEGSMVIPNGVDTVNFRPGAQALARRALSLPEDARILLAVAHRIRSSPWKDFALLEKAFGIVCRRAPSENTILLVVGDAGIDQADRGAGLRYIPPLGDDSKMAMAYQAADLYVHPAKADTFPTTVLEAMACGLPVVATSVGGIPEQVVEGETGSLVPAGDPEALAIRILELLNNAHRRQSMGRNAAVRAQQLYTRPRMIDAYLAWYEEILGGARARENLQ